MNVRFDLDNPIMRAILGIAEYFLDNRRNKIRSRAVVFPLSEPREIYAKKIEEILGRRTSLGLQFCRSLLRVPSIYCDSKERLETAPPVWHKIKIFSLIFLLEDKCNLKSNKSCEDCVQDGVR